MTIVISANLMPKNTYRELQNMWQTQANETHDLRSKRIWQAKADEFKWLADQLDRQ